MTRTMHNAYPAAVLKDKHSRSGHKDDTQRKGGAGAHNWGALGERGNQEAAGEQDAAGEATGDVDRMFDMDETDAAATPAAGQDRRDTIDSDGGAEGKREEDIAQSPTDSMASIDSANVAVERPIKGRRMSSMSQEDQEHAMAYRQTFGLRPNGASLADIARTSFGAQSPPKADALAGSPTKGMRAYAK